MEKGKKKESAGLRFLYHTIPGRILLRPLCSRSVSKFCGMLLSSRISKPLIPGFLRKNHIDLTEFEKDTFDSFNDCFTRKIKASLRPIDQDPSHLIAPCDGLLSVYAVNDDTVIPVKQSAYTLTELLGNDPVAKSFRDGYCFVFRLCVNHYHRYAYFDSGEKGDNHFLPGKLHTVRPIALNTFPVFVQNCREYTVIESSNFGKAVQMEVGALLVGKISNHDGAGIVSRGTEKGMFLYGGSTIILLLEKDAIEEPTDYINATKQERETPVLLGQKIGKMQVT